MKIEVHVLYSSLFSALLATHALELRDNAAVKIGRGAATQIKLQIIFVLLHQFKA